MSGLRRYGFVLIAFVCTLAAGCQGVGPPRPNHPMGSPPPGPPPQHRTIFGGVTDSSESSNSRQNEKNARPESTVSMENPGLQLAPPGRWWDDSQFARSLGLSIQQQHQMDAVFEKNRSTILGLYQEYLRQEAQLGVLVRAKVADEPALLAQIERVGRARIALEQANTHTLVQIRAMMSAQQIDRLDSHR